MARLVTAYALYNGQTNEYVGGQGTIITINCERLQAFSPRPVWLQRWLAPGDGTLVIYQPTFELNSADVAAYGSNIIQGFWIQQDDFSGIIDVASLSTFLTACNGCCDDSVPVPLTRYYTSGVPDFTAPTVSNYCIARVDDGGSDAFQTFAEDYNPLQGVNIGYMRSHTSGISYYNVTSAVPITPIGTDSVVAGVCTG